AVDAENDPTLRQDTGVAHFKSAVIAARLGAVDEAIKEYKSAQQIFSELAKTDPQATEPQAQLALPHNNLGLLYAARSNADLARQEYIHAIETQKALVRDHADDPEFAGQLAESEANLGLMLDQTGDANGAGQALQAAIDVLRPLSDAQKGQ